MTKILLVEDDKSLREIYGVRLLAEGYDIISAGDGEAALAMAIKERPALIVSDVMMPKISGFDMLDILRSTTETKNIKVIMMTALSSDDQRKRGEELGADKYLVKSQVGIEDVVRAVHEVLGDAPSLGGSPSPAPAPEPTPETPAPAAPAPPAAAPAATEPAPAPKPATPAAPAPASGESTLPQPTAPFSTPRVGNLADRVIHPIEREEPSADVIADKIEAELGTAPAATGSEPAPVPVLTPEPEAPAPPQEPAPAITPPPEETPAPATPAPPPVAANPAPAAPAQPTAAAPFPPQPSA